MGRMRRSVLEIRNAFSMCQRRVPDPGCEYGCWKAFPGLSAPFGLIPFAEEIVSLEMGRDDEESVGLAAITDQSRPGLWTCQPFEWLDTVHPPFGWVERWLNHFDFGVFVQTCAYFRFATPKTLDSQSLTRWKYYAYIFTLLKATKSGIDEPL